MQRKEGFPRILVSKKIGIFEMLRPILLRKYFKIYYFLIPILALKLLRVLKKNKPEKITNILQKRDFFILKSHEKLNNLQVVRCKG